MNGKRVLGRKTKWGIIEGERSRLHPQPSPGLLGHGEKHPWVHPSLGGGGWWRGAVPGLRWYPESAGMCSPGILLPVPPPAGLALQWRTRRTASSPSCGTC